MLVLLKRFLGKQQSQMNKEQVESLVQQIQQGDEKARNDFLKKYQPFVGQVASKVCKRYIDPAHDDEFSVALEAFNEALHQFRQGKGSSFFSFADLVIRRRVIDYIRKESRRRKHTYSFDETMEVEGNGNGENQYEVEASTLQYALDQEASMRREEIAHFQERLQEYGIRLLELPDNTPKHVDARQNAVEIAKTVVGHPELRKRLLQKKRLPMKELMDHIGMSRKTVERNRNYIIAVALILIEDYQYLRSYVNILHDQGGEVDEERNSYGSGEKMGYGTNSRR